MVRGLLSDPSVAEVIVAPGNAGIAADVACLPLDVSDAAAVASLATSVDADLVVIGPEVPLVAGAADAVRDAGIPCFGPSAEAARLEGSKAFAKGIMEAAGVPTAAAFVCDGEEAVVAALEELGAPHVVKDDGLAAGKGVVVTDDFDEALAHARECLAKDGGRVVVEEYLDGPEVSLFCLCDGARVIPLAPAQDFKRIGDGDAGGNTGGMGAYSPLPWAPPGLVQQVVEDVAQPTVDAMALRGTPFSGVLYVGLALTSRGLRVVEFNVRFGDPETQVVLARLGSPLGELLFAAATGSLAGHRPLQWLDDSAVTVVMAAAGYPGTPTKGDVISGLHEAHGLPGVHVLHAGTALDEDGNVVTNGGRVLSVTALGSTLTEARDHAYQGVAAISWDGEQHRSDIALKAATEAAATHGEGL